MDVHLRDVRAFVAVAEHLHFSRAAEALFVSQPVLSRQVRALEQALHLELFIRDRRTTRLTPAGEAVLPAAREALAAWSAAQSAGAAAATAARADVTVGISLGIERGLLPRVRKHLNQLAPAVELQLRRVPWSDPTSGLITNDTHSALRAVDAAFVWLPLPGGYRFDWVEVASEPRWLVMSSRHRLAARDSVAFSDVVHEPFLALPADAGPARDSWLGADARHGQPALVAAEAASPEELVKPSRPEPASA